MWSYHSSSHTIPLPFHSFWNEAQTPLCSTHAEPAYLPSCPPCPAFLQPLHTARISQNWECWLSAHAHLSLCLSAAPVPSILSSHQPQLRAPRQTPSRMIACFPSAHHHPRALHFSFPLQGSQWVFIFLYPAQYLADKW